MEQNTDAGTGIHRLDGFIDHADWHSIRGWAYDTATPDRAVWLEVVVDDGAPVAFLSNMHRKDLSLAGFGDGRFGFDLRFPEPLDARVRHSIVVRRRSDGLALQEEPVTLVPAPMAAAEVRAAFEAAVASELEAAANGTELDATLGFLLRQVDRLLQGRAEIDSGARALNLFRLRWSDYLDGERVLPQQPDARPWVLVIDVELPDVAEPLAMVSALQLLGYRVAVVASRSLATTGAIAQSLGVMGVTVHGMPEHFTVEDVLRRHRGQFRCVVLRGPAIAAAYGVVARMHQPRARILACLGDPPRDMSDGVLNLGGSLMADAVVVETADAAAMLKGQLPGRSFHVIAPDDEVSMIAEGLVAAGIVKQRRPPEPVVEVVPEAVAAVEPPPSPPPLPVLPPKPREARVSRPVVGRLIRKEDQEAPPPGPPPGAECLEPDH